MQHNQICRTCLCTGNSTFLSVDAAVLNSNLLVPIKDLLLFCMPEFVLDIVPNAVICNVCLIALHTAFSFKKRCQRTEKRIEKYICNSGIRIDMVDLRKVIGLDLGINFSDKDCSNEANGKSDLPHSSEYISEELTIVKEELVDNLENMTKVKSEPVDFTADAVDDATANSNSVASSQIDGIDKPYKCTLCETSYKREIELLAHVMSHKLQQDGNKAKHNTHLTPHVQSVAVDSLKEFLPKQSDNIDELCEICRKRFYSKSNLAVHMRIHTGEKSYKCSACKKAFTQEVYLIAHERTHTGETPFECSLCHKSFAQKSYLRTHMIVHAGIRYLICRVCGKGCPHTADLNNHMRIHTGEKPYKCEDCGKCFARVVNLNSHMKIHVKEKLYECELCPLKYTESRYLKKHMWLHTEERRFCCHICKKTFQESSLLSDHLKSHPGERPWPSSACDKTYSKTSNLMRTHTGEKPYSCTDCGVKFAYKQSLNAHRKTHTKDDAGAHVNSLVLVKNELPDFDGIVCEPSTIRTSFSDLDGDNREVDHHRKKNRLENE